MKYRNTGLARIAGGFLALAAVAVAGCNRREAATDRAPEAASQSAASVEPPPPSDLASRDGWPPAPRAPRRDLQERSVGGQTLFTALPPSQTGVDFTNPLDSDHPKSRLFHSGFVCGGVAIGDVDGDDRPDVFFASGPRGNRLYRQVDDFRFEDITETAGVSGGDAWGAGAAMADIDDDGDLDIYVSNYEAPNQLFINVDGKRFRESAAEYGLDLVDASLMPAFCDYDRDGDLDVYLLTNRLYRAGGRPKKPPYSVRDGKPYVLPEYEKYYALKRKGRGRYTVDNAGRPDHLYRNNGDGTFTDVSKSAGIVGRGHGLSVTWWDCNGDGWPDAYIGNDFNDPDRLYRNNRDGTFTNIISEVIPTTSWFSMGADFGDFNGDGVFDLLVGDMAATTHYGRATTMTVMNAERLASVAGPPPQVMKNALYVGAGAGAFLEVAELAGLADTDWTWAVKVADFDNDGLNDAYFANGTVRIFTHADHAMASGQMIGRTEWDHYASRPAGTQPNLAFRNQGDLNFADVSSEWGLDQVSMSYGAAYADLDRDGDLDLVVANLDEPVSIYRNDSTEGARLVVALRGTASNRRGIGAKLWVETPDGRQVRMLSPQTGYMSSNEPVVHFGLGEQERIERLVVEWPSGARQELMDVAANQYLTLTEPDSDSSPSDPEFATASDPTPMHQRSDALGSIRHVERAYDDNARQPLLPKKLSQLGPGIAVGDFDADGDEDLYIGGAAGQAGQLLSQSDDGVFQPVQVAAFEADKASEDMGAVWFDADGDRDLDLYVASGGVEADAGAPTYGDRLYLNDGAGQFTQAEDGALPELRDSSSAVAAADFDRDGDLDLVIGTRVIPGDYPTPPASHLLENRGGQFVDATADLAPALAEAGLVTGAIWSDANGDGWIDLLLTVEWGPVRLFLNQQGKLVEATADAGLADRLGWWNGIAARDLDGDGDIDYVVTNFGRNSRRHPTAERPIRLYYGDFEDSGTKRLVEAYYDRDGKLRPVRNMNSSAGAMPLISLTFNSHDDFARASLEEIYPSDRLESALKLAATTLDSGALVNDGSGRFEFRPLPWQAQAAPCFGLVVSEFDGDGVPDLYVAQNFRGGTPELGKYGAGLSLLMTGKGDGDFTPLGPEASGLVVTGPATAAVECVASSGRLLVVGVNSGSVQAFERRLQTVASSETQLHQLVSVVMKGLAGNDAAIGARVDVQLRSGTSQSAEVIGGGGYLSQSSPALQFGLPSGDAIERIDVRWPDGTESTHAWADSTSIELMHPSRTGG